MENRGKFPSRLQAKRGLPCADLNKTQQTLMDVSCSVRLYEMERKMYNTVCPTRYRTRHFFNNSNSNEDIATKFEQGHVRCVRNEEECVCSALNSSLVVKLLKKSRVR
jgi:hypothetical protein